MTRPIIPVLALLVLLVSGPAGAAGAAEAPAAPEPPLPEKAACCVCEMRGAGHGEEKVAAWREREGERYFFCSEPCRSKFLAEQRDSAVESASGAADKVPEANH